MVCRIWSYNLMPSLLKAFTFGRRKWLLAGTLDFHNAILRSNRASVGMSKSTCRSELFSINLADGLKRKNTLHQETQFQIYALFWGFRHRYVQVITKHPKNNLSFPISNSYYCNYYCMNRKYKEALAHSLRPNRCTTEPKRTWKN